MKASSPNCPQCEWPVEPGAHFCANCLHTLDSRPENKANPPPQTTEPARVAQAEPAEPPRAAAGPGRNCPHCGFPADAEARFCDNCLKEIRGPDAPQTKTSPAAGQAPAPPPLPGFGREPEFGGPVAAPQQVVRTEQIIRTEAPRSQAEHVRQRIVARNVNGQFRVAPLEDSPVYERRPMPADRPAGAGPTTAPPRTAMTPAPRKPDPITHGPEPDEASADACDFHIEYNNARIFLKGSRSSFNFRLKPTSSACRRCADMQMELQIGAAEIPPEPVYPFTRPEPREIDFAFKPEEDGIDIPAKLFFRYTRDGRRTQYLGRLLWDCYPQSESAQAINVKIDELNLVGDRASRQNVELLKGLDAKTPESRADQLRGLKLVPVWAPLPLVLVPCDDVAARESHLAPPPARAQRQRLTLAGNDLRVHLLSDTKLTLGRNRGCDLVTRVCGPDARADKKSNEKLSRYHCEIGLEGERCWVTDEAYDPEKKVRRPSSFGVWVNKTRVPRGQSSALLPNTHGTVALAGEDENDPQAFTFQSYLWACDSAQRQKCRLPAQPCPADAPGCLILHRCDGLRQQEIFVVIWRCCPMALVHESFGDVVLCRSRQAFACKQKETDSWLTPGETVQMGSNDMRVETYQQVGL
ncbi:MAG: zinc ribbon domain-containing protein [Kiritimatiellae bacterium]|nr:zinc ribbon domain-containing protein [Kiritimatiellia bacterium]